MCRMITSKDIFVISFNDRSQTSTLVLFVDIHSLMLYFKVFVAIFLLHSFNFKAIK